MTHALPLSHTHFLSLSHALPLSLTRTPSLSHTHAYSFSIALSFYLLPQCSGEQRDGGWQDSEGEGERCQGESSEGCQIRYHVQVWYSGVREALNRIWIIQKRGVSPLCCYSRYFHSPHTYFLILFCLSTYSFFFTFLLSIPFFSFHLSNQRVDWWPKRRSSLSSCTPMLSPLLAHSPPSCCVLCWPASRRSGEKLQLSRETTLQLQLQRQLQHQLLQQQQVWRLRVWVQWVASTEQQQLQ